MNRFLTLMLITFCSLGMYAQSITGVVTDAQDGSTMPGVNVTVVGTTRGVVTDNFGKYTIEAGATESLQFRYIGYKDQIVKVGNKTSINVKISQDVAEIGEVVVTALGIKKEKKALGYAMTSLKGDELVKGGNPANPVASLYGKAAGVRISSTGAGPQGGMVMNIRGAVSLNENESTRPLIVVDGIPILDNDTHMGKTSNTSRVTGSGLNDINPSDIASMEILKGAKAAVLYGSAGANGVVLITTKNGSKQKGFGVQVSVTQSVSTLMLQPDWQNEFGAGGTITAGDNPTMVDAQGFRYSLVNGVKTKTWTKSSGDGGASFGPRMDGSQMLWWDGKMHDYSPQPNNYRDLFQTGHDTQANVVLQNGTDKGSYRASYTIKKWNGLTLGAQQDAQNFSLNATSNISDRIKITSVSNYYYTKDHNAPMIPESIITYPMGREEHTQLIFDNTIDQNGYWGLGSNGYQKSMGKGSRAVSGEYVWQNLRNSTDDTKHHFIESANLSIQLTDWLSAQLLAGFDYTQATREIKEYMEYPLGPGHENQGYYGVNQTSNMDMYSQYSLNFNKKLTEDFNLSGLVGGVYKTVERRNQNTYIKDAFLLENYFSLSNADPRKIVGQGTRGRDDLQSVLASAQLTYKDYLYLEAQARNDWSSILPPSNNSYFYPGLSVSWVVSQALKLPAVINYAKVRASWADVGRPGDAYFGNMSYALGSINGIPYISSPVDIPPVTVDANGKVTESLKPEKKREFEIGFEMNFFKGNRLGLDFSYYKSNTYNQIIPLGIAATSGAKSVKINAGDIGQNGFELQIKGIPVQYKNFQWESTVNLSHSVTRINELANGIEEIIATSAVTGADGVQVVSPVGGTFGEIRVHPYKRDAKGNLLVNSAGIYDINTGAWKSVGHVTPDLLAGFINNFTYKRVSLGVNIDAQFGGTAISQTNQYLYSQGNTKSTLKYRDEARGGLPYYINNAGNMIPLASHTAGVPADSKFGFIFHDGVVLPGVASDGTQNTKLVNAQSFYSMYWRADRGMNEDRVYKSDFICLRQISLGYDLPDNYTNKIGLYKVRISLYGNNISYLYKPLPDVSPESSNGTNTYGEQAGSTMSRTWGVNLKLTF